jgi:hypothetical protein
VARPPLALERLEAMIDGRLAYRLAGVCRGSPRGQAEVGEDAADHLGLLDRGEDAHRGVPRAIVLTRPGT